jgi:hypothetical protein
MSEVNSGFTSSNPEISSVYARVKVLHVLLYDDLPGFYVDGATSLLSTGGRLVCGRKDTDRASSGSTGVERTVTCHVSTTTFRGGNGSWLA